MLQLIKKNAQVFLYLICIDLIIVLLHLFLARNWTFFHLDHELNLPTFWQSGKLIFFGVLFFSANFTKNFGKELKFFMLPLTIFVTFLGLDELLQIHENIYRIFELLPWLHPSKIVDASMKLGYRSSLWILYYLPLIFLFVFWSGYWLRYFQDKIKSNFWIILTSSFSLLTILIMEIMSSTGTYSDSTYFIMVTFEEGAEMLLGSTLVLVGLKVLDRAILQKTKNH